ncbi:GIN domain-containing protein [Sphingomonas sp. MMS24-JH45]
MMRLVSFLLLAVAVSASTPALATEDRGSGIVGERQGDAFVYRVANFHAIAVGTAGTAEVRVGPAWSLRITGPAAPLANLRVVVKDGRLEIGKRDQKRRDAGEERITIALTVPRLDEAALGGSGRMRIDRVGGRSFAAMVGGSGGMTIGEIAADAGGAVDRRIGQHPGRGTRPRGDGQHRRFRTARCPRAGPDVGEGGGGGIGRRAPPGRRRRGRVAGRQRFRRSRSQGALHRDAHGQRARFLRALTAFSSVLL